MDTERDAGLDIATAAARLGTSKEALRKRLQRGSVPGRKVDGEWRVYPDGLPTDQDTRQDTAGTDPGAVVAVLRDELERWQHEAERWQREAEQKNVIIMSLMRQLPAPREGNQDAQLEDRGRADRRRQWWRFWR